MGSLVLEKCTTHQFSALISSLHSNGLQSRGSPVTSPESRAGFLLARSAERGAEEVMGSSEQHVCFAIGKKKLETFESFWELWSGAQAEAPSKSSLRENRGSLCLVQTGRSAGRASARLLVVTWGLCISVTRIYSYF